MIGVTLRPGCGDAPQMWPILVAGLIHVLSGTIPSSISSHTYLAIVAQKLLRCQGS